MGRMFGGLLLLFSLMATPACKSKNRDAEIQTAFASKTQTDPNLAGVNAAVSEGVVTLTGTCADANCKTNAEKAVKDIDGVKRVVNNITIAEVQVSPDAQLQTAAQNVASQYEDVQVSVADGVITLRGQLERAKLQQLMQDLNALNPKRVDNQLVLK